MGLFFKVAFFEVKRKSSTFVFPLFVSASSSVVGSLLFVLVYFVFAFVFFACVCGRHYLLFLARVFPSAFVFRWHVHFSGEDPILLDLRSLASLQSARCQMGDVLGWLHECVFEGTLKWCFPGGLHGVP